jgi:hypothetical protein
MLTASEAEVARHEEDMLEASTIPSDRKVWLCLHCLDLPAEESWMTLEGIEYHVKFSCVIFSSDSVFFVKLT